MTGSLYLYRLQTVQTKQGRRRFLKSGTAIERHRRFARAEGTRRGEPSSRKGG